MVGLVTPPSQSVLNTTYGPPARGFVQPPITTATLAPTPSIWDLLNRGTDEGNDANKDGDNGGVGVKGQIAGSPFSDNEHSGRMDAREDLKNAEYNVGRTPDAFNEALTGLGLAIGVPGVGLFGSIMDKLGLRHGVTGPTGAGPDTPDAFAAEKAAMRTASEANDRERRGDNDFTRGENTNTDKVSDPSGQGVYSGEPDRQTRGGISTNNGEQGGSGGSGGDVGGNASPGTGGDAGGTDESGTTGPGGAW